MNQLDPFFETLTNTIRPTIYLHGNKGFDSCEICDIEVNEENPGKEVRYIHNGQKYCACVCVECFNEEAYQEMLKEKNVTQIVNYN